jgi:hypothetical protein
MRSRKFGGKEEVEVEVAGEDHDRGLCRKKKR